MSVVEPDSVVAQGFFIPQNLCLGAYIINENIFFIDEVKSINQSEFALSKDVRSACRSAEESQMGFYPTVVKNNFYFEAVLIGFSLFFDYNGIKGSDLELANKKWNDANKNIFDLSKESKTLVLVKEQLSKSQDQSISFFS